MRRCSVPGARAPSGRARTSGGACRVWWRAAMRAAPRSRSPLPAISCSSRRKSTSGHCAPRSWHAIRITGADSRRRWLPLRSRAPRPPSPLGPAADPSPVITPVRDESAAFAPFERLAAREARPELMALLDAANERRLPHLLDDTLLTLGAGEGGRDFELAALPDVADVPWGELRDIPTAVVTGSNGKTTTVRLLRACARGPGPGARLARRLLLHRRGVPRPAARGNRGLLRPGGCASRAARAPRPGRDRGNRARRHSATRTRSVRGAGGARHPL